MKKFLNEFKEFTLRGNVIDLAVGVIIGASFKAIVDSLVDDIITPLIGSVANIDFKDVALSIGDVQIGVGAFITAIINFLIMALVIFSFVKIINRLSTLTKKEDESPAAPTTKDCPHCYSSIHINATRCPNCTSEVKV